MKEADIGDNADIFEIDVTPQYEAKKQVQFAAAAPQQVSEESPATKSTVRDKQEPKIFEPEAIIVE